MGKWNTFAKYMIWAAIVGALITVGVFHIRGRHDRLEQKVLVQPFEDRTSKPGAASYLENNKETK